MKRDKALADAEASWVREGLERIPVLDLSDYLAGVEGALEVLGNQLRHAQENIGFFYLKNHGVPQATIDRMFAATAAFHALPLDSKLKLKVDSDQIGYIPLGGSVLSSDLKRDNKPDQSSAMWVRRERGSAFFRNRPKRRFEAPNKWPANLPEFRTAAAAYADAMEALGRSLLPIYAVALDLAPDYFSGMFIDNDIPMRLGHYPPTPKGDADEFGIAPHTDAGFLTLLPQAAEPGLEVLTQVGQWIPAPKRSGEILVNGGDCLVRLTNGRFLSTPHRVMTGLPRDRYSIPLFFNPNFDAKLSPAPTCVSADRPPRFATITYHEYVLEFLARNYPHQAAAN